MALGRSKKREIHVAETQREGRGPFKRVESLTKNRHEAMKSTSAAFVDKKVDDVSVRIARFFSDDPSLQLESTTNFRKILSLTVTPPIQNVTPSGVVPRFASFLKKEDFPDLQAIWVLGNVPAHCCDYALRCGPLMPLFAQLNEHTTFSMLSRTATSIASNFCRGQPLPPFGQVHHALLALERLVHSNVEEGLIDDCLALWYWPNYSEVFRR